MSDVYAITRDARESARRDLPDEAGLRGIIGSLCDAIDAVAEQAGVPRPVGVENAGEDPA